MKLSRLSARAAFVAAALVATVASAASVLTGSVVDASSKQAVVDVVVTATSPNLQGEQIVVTDPDGTFRIPQLPPGTYTLRFEKESYKPFSRGDIVLRSDQTIRLNVELLPEAIQAEEIVVTGRAPSIDVGSTTTGVSVGSEMVSKLALVRPGSKNSASRSFESLAEIAPGANADAYGVSVSGTTSPENQFVIDGLSVNDPAFGLLGTPLTVDFIQEVNVITGGYMPEFGRATGGVMSVVTKSGSNEFHGSVFGNWTPGLLEGTPALAPEAGSVIRTERKLWNQGDVGAEIGGPIIKDKLWFFVGFAPSWNRYQLKRSLNRFLIGDDGAPLLDADGLPQTELLPGGESTYFADQVSYQYIGKLTFLVNQDHNLTLSVYGAPTQSGGPGKFSFSSSTGAPEIRNIVGSYDALSSLRRADSSDVALKWSSAFLEKNLLLDVTVGWHHQTNSVLPTDGSDVGGTTGLASLPSFHFLLPHTIEEFEPLTAEARSLCRTDASGNPLADPSIACPVDEYFLGGYGQISTALLDRLQGKAVGTYIFKAAGSHVAKAGIDVELLSYANRRSYTGGVALEEGQLGGTDTWDEVRQYGYVTAPDEAVVRAVQEATSTSTTIGGFLQDSWDVANLFTVNAGLRYDQQVIFDKDGRVAMALNNQVSPRVGFVYDFTRQGRSKIFANFARFYEGVPLNIADRAFGDERQFGRLRSRTAGATCDPLADFQSAIENCVSDDPDNFLVRGSRSNPNQLVRIIGGGKTLVDPDLVPQSSDELVVGGEYEVFADGRAGVSYTRRYMNDIIEDMSRDEANTYFLGNPGRGIAAEGFPKAVRDYDAVTVYLNKMFADQWLAQASYTYSRLYGNWAGLFRPETNQLDPNINSDFDLQSLLPNREGPLPGDSTHAFKAFVSRDFVLTGALGLNVGVSYRSRSGTPLSYTGAHPLYGASEAFILPRGAAGRLPWRHDFDGRLGVTYRISKDSALTVSVDVFNLLNLQGVTLVDEEYTKASVLPYQGADATPEGICAAGDTSGCTSPLTVINDDFTTRPFTADDLNKNFLNPRAFQAPRTFRFGAKLTF